MLSNHDQIDAQCTCHEWDKATNFDSKLQDRTNVCSYHEGSLLDVFVERIKQDTVQSSSYLPVPS